VTKKRGTGKGSVKSRSASKAATGGKKAERGRSGAAKKTKSSAGKSGGGGFALTAGQRREIVAVGMLAIALVCLLSLVPVSIFGQLGDQWFTQDNMLKGVGASIKETLLGGVGHSAILVPILFGVLGLRVGNWLSWEWTIRSGLLVTGLLVIVPIAVWTLSAENPVPAGWLGKLLGKPLVELLGPFGAMLVDGVLFVGLSIATLGWNPLRSVGKGVIVSGEAAGRTAKVLADKGKELKEVHAQNAAARAERMVVQETGGAVEGFAPDWMDGADKTAGDDPGPRSTSTSDEGLPVEEGATEAHQETPSGSSGDAEAGEVAEDEWDAEHEGDLVDPNAGSDIEHEVPPVDLLSAPQSQDRTSMERELDKLGEVLVDKLRTFNVESSLGGRTTGPVVTQFEVVPAPGVKVNRIANLDADLALAMKARTIRIVAPIPGKGAVGVEIPNPQPEIVNLREMLEAPNFRRAKGELPLALGKDLNGKPYVAALEKMPHLLIAGATGAGKSVCLNTIVTSLVYRHTPETLRLLMIDPKMVELSVYSRLPHLRHNVVTDPRDAAGVLKWAVLEMERRYALLKANYVRSLGEFNKKVREDQVLRRSEPKGPEGDEDRWIYSEGVMPYIVVVVDELADLMMTVQSEVEKPLTQLAQKARAIGIHLIVATQRPSVNVITGLIKANFPTRIAFRVASKTDSRTILDQNGADALLGNGDMLFLPPGGSVPVRIQGAYLSTEDTERLMGWYVDLLEKHASESGTTLDVSSEPDILQEVREQQEEESGGKDAIKGDWDELFRAAAEVCIQNGGGSTSLLQRRLSIGYGRAARIVDQLHDAEVLGPSDGSKGREVLVMMDELDDIC
jgi:S-DNA-T family DNA segregation ATPase FtsK/SpoIIIE